MAFGCLVLPGAAAAADLYFPQIADGHGYRTQLTLVNNGTRELSGRLEFFSPDGSPLTLELEALGNVSSLQVALAGRGTARYRTTGRGTLRVGYARYSGAGSLSGVATFQVRDGTTLVSEAAVLASPAVSAAGLPAERLAQVDTGLAVVSLDGASLQAMLVDPAGATVQSRTLFMPRGGHTALFVSQLFDLPWEFTGQVLLSSTGRFAVTGLRMSEGLFSALPVGSGEQGTRVLFSPLGGVQARLVQEIDGATSSLDIAIYSFTADPVGEAVLRARNRGVAVRLVADLSQSGQTGSEIGMLTAAGVAVRRVTGLPNTSGGNGIMHHKFALVDGSRLLTGSYNWSFSAENFNYENLVITDSPALVEAFADHFQMLWGLPATAAGEVIPGIPPPGR